MYSIVQKEGLGLDKAIEEVKVTCNAGLNRRTTPRPNARVHANANANAADLLPPPLSLAAPHVALPSDAEHADRAAA
jgi:hypothetical protein